MPNEPDADEAAVATESPEAAPVPRPLAAVLARGTDAERREAARALGSVTSDRKREAARANWSRVTKHGPDPRPLHALACKCGRGDTVEAPLHTTACPRGRAARRRVRIDG